MVICIMGESGAGKTTSLKNLNPAETYYIDCDKKGLSWKGWRKQYSAENKNYSVTDEQAKVLALLKGINEKCPKIHNVVIDTLNGIMVADEMRRMKEKSFDKWVDLATSVYNIIDYALTVRNDLNVIFLCHTQTEHTDDGFTFTRIKTSGKKLDKIVIESKMPVVLHAKVIDGRYLFETGADFSTAKTPLGAFEEQYIENDIAKVLEALKEY